MKYIINYTEGGKILGFCNGDTDLNIELSNDVWFEAQSFNKIIVNGENISFDNVEWRTEEELNKEATDKKLAEAQAYLGSTDFYYPRFLETGESVPEDVVLKRTEAREFIRLNKVAV